MSIELKPEVIKIPFDSPDHSRILEKLMQRKIAGRAARASRKDKWDESEQIFSAYVHETEIDARRRVLRDNSGIPQYATVTIPYAYATLMTAHTYFTSVFLARSPVYQVQGVGAESTDSESALESLLTYQLDNGRNLAPLYLWMLDHGKYGEGYMCQYWSRESAKIPIASWQPKRFMGFPVPGTKKAVTEFQEIVTYEGNRYFNIRPQDMYHDPSVTAARLQEGDFVGWERFVAFNEVRKQAIDGYFYNIDKISQRRGAFRGQESTSVSTLPAAQENVLSEDDIRGVILDEIIVEIVPSEWKLPKMNGRDDFEKIAFTIANEEVIVGCRPLGMFHNEYPIDVMEYEMEAYNVAKRGMLEMLKPMNDTLEWLVNTHFYNVRKALNNEWIYDPSVLLSKDIERPGPGKLIRVRPEKYGTDVRSAFYQVQQMDITQNHLKDAQLIIEMMQRLTGVNDSVMGVLGNTRRTATEVRTSSSFAVNRLKTMCEYMSAVGFAPHTKRLIQSSQQYLEGSTTLRKVSQDGSLQMIDVTPEAIAGNYNYVPVDGAMPIDRTAQAGMMNNILTSAARIPQIGNQLDMFKIFAFMSKNLMGIRNFDSFKLQAQIMPTEQVQQQVQAGNMIPVPGVDNGV